MAEACAGRGSQWRQVNPYHFIVASSFTSFFEAATLYPFDVLKTRQQANPALPIASSNCRWGTAASAEWRETCGGEQGSGGSTRCSTPLNRG